MSAKTTKKLIAKVKSFSDLRAKAKTDERYQKLAIAAAENVGGPATDFEGAIRYLLGHVMSLVGEYGMDEDEAEETMLDEINFCRDCI